LVILAVAWVRPALAHGDVALELEHVTELIEARPMDAALYLWRGELRRLGHDWVGAQDDFARAAEFGSAAIRDELGLYRGRLYQEAQESHRAVAELDAYVERHPRHVDALRARALAHAQLGAVDAADADYARVLALDSARRSPELWLERSRVLIGAGRVDAALAAIDEAIAELGPLVTLVEFGIDAEIEREQYAAALDRMAALPAAVADTPLWLGRRGDLLGKLDRTEDAARAYGRAREAILRMPAQRRQTLAMQELLARLGPAAADATSLSP
jgi:tetratricopeptide (TPR) repeat protein